MEELQKILATMLTPLPPGELAEVWSFQHRADSLIVVLHIDSQASTINLSIDPTQPFSGRSLLEVSIAFDAWRIDHEPDFYGDQPLLRFTRSGPTGPEPVLSLITWPDGRLSIWLPR